jgi:hypothetical protein
MAVPAQAARLPVTGVRFLIRRGAHAWQSASGGGPGKARLSLKGENDLKFPEKRL